MDTTGLLECKTCGAVVKSKSRHVAWHNRVEAIEGVASAAMEAAEDAQQTADEAANVLYQNNIST